MPDESKDFATGKSINISHPEEKVRQEYERILVNDYGYPKKDIDIEVPIQIGSRSCLCDIAVYENKKIIGIVETKAPQKKDGEKQLTSYMSATPTCRWGVWTNGHEELCAIRSSNGEIKFDEASSVPRYGKGWPSIKSFDDLKPASNLKRTFKIINNALYANTNLARTEKQGAEMVRLIFCKLVDEYNIRDTGDEPAFQVYQDETDIKDKTKMKRMRKRIEDLWKDTKEGWVGSSIFSKAERIEIDNYSLRLIVSKLQSYSLLKTKKDIVGDAFEVFSERQFIGDKGQFFTPRAVVNMVVEMISPKKTDKIIDPACGSGGFLISALDYITKQTKIDTEKQRIAEHCLFGIDKEPDLTKICKAHMCIIGDGKSNIVNQDSLKPVEDWGDEARAKITADEKFLQFDVCLTNPPFGSQIKVNQSHVLGEFHLGHKWKKSNGVWEQTSKTKPTPPQILFLELCLRLLKPRGKLGIVLPDGLLGNKGDGYIRHYIKTQAEILAIVDCPTATFMPHTGTKTSVLILQKIASPPPPPSTHIHANAPPPPPYIQGRAFFAIAEHCGHTMRGRDIEREDFSTVAKNYGTRNNRAGHLGFTGKYKDILVPRYYDPRIVAEIKKLEKQGDFQMITVKELQDRGEIKINNMQSTVGSEDYDLHGDIRFIRTSDICGNELYGQTQKMVTRETYLKYKDKQDLKIGDILFVKDGDNKIGDTAILLDEHDLEILVQTHFKKIRPLKIDPFLFLWIINKKIVKKQIRQRVFNQSTLSTIGDRTEDLRLPIPSSENEKRKIAKKMKELVEGRRKYLRILQDEMK